MPAMKLVYLQESPYKAWKAQIAAKYQGIALEAKVYNENQDKLAMAHNPWNRLPYLEMEAGVVANSNAIARYIGKLRPDKELFGETFADSCLVDSWMEFCTREIEIPAGVLVFAEKKLLDVPAAAKQKAAADLEIAFGLLEGVLVKSKCLVGEEITLADICVVCSLVDVISLVPAAAKFPSLLGWFKACAVLPHFAASLPKGAAGKAPAPGKPAAPAKPAAAPAPTKPAAAPAPTKPAVSAPAPAAAKPAAAVSAPAAAGAAASGGPTAGTPEDHAALQAAKDKVRDLKASKADADTITAAVAEMKRLKEVCGEVDPPKEKQKKKKK